MSVPVGLVNIVNQKSDKNFTVPLDLSDLLHWRSTPFILGFFVFVVGSAQTFGMPVSCFIPTEVDRIGSWKSYIYSFCFLEGTYVLNHNETLAKMPESLRKIRKMENGIEYYQWVPFFLMFQGVCFLVPALLWRYSRSLLYLDLDTVLKTSDAIKDSIVDSQAKNEKLDQLSGYLYESLHNSYQSTMDRHWLTMCYILAKIASLVNSIQQFILVMSFMGIDDVFWGYYILESTRLGYTTSEFFPLNVLCDVKIEGMAQSNTHTLQCLLSLNFFHDKIFAFLWFWYLLLIMSSVISIVSFIFVLIPHSSRLDRILPNEIIQSNSRLIHSFYSDILFSDGLLALTFISKMKGPQIAQEIATKLFEKYAAGKTISAWRYPDSFSKKHRSPRVEFKKS